MGYMITSLFDPSNKESPATPSFSRQAKVRNVELAREVHPVPVLQELMLFLKSRGNEDFIESVISCFCAPVTAGLKCASLVNLSRCGREVLDDWLLVRAGLSRKLSVRFAEMSCTRRSVLLLVYRERSLLRALSAEGVRDFLARFGYARDFTSTAPCVARLAERFACRMPHEVGVFLDYPLEDVRGFIENEGRDAKFAGYWKVYGNEIEAMRRFEAFRRAERRSASRILQRAQGLTEAA